MNHQEPTEPTGDDVARWTADMVAKRCGVNRSTVYDWIRSGRLPPGVEHLEHFTHQRRFVVRVAELDAWVRTGRTLP